MDDRIQAITERWSVGDQSYAHGDITTLLAEINQLRLALYQYGGHVLPCPGRPCECGFLAQWQAAQLPATLLDAARIALLNPAPESPSSASEEPR